MRLGIIGGSSLVTFDPKDAFGAIGLTVASTETLTAKNEYGSVRLKKIELANKDKKIVHTIFFMQRHGMGPGITPPHRINHKANIRGLYDQKLDAIVATSSVGTIVSNFPPGRVGVCEQYIDLTGAVVTYHEENAQFTSVTTPFAPRLNAALLKTLRRVQKLSSSVQLEFTYWLSPGPYYETPAEVNAAERMGAHICGMTCVREAKLCRELDLDYTSLAIASNWAAGRHPGDPNFQLSHEEVSEMSARVTGTVVQCIVDLLKNGIPAKANGSSSYSAPPTPDKSPKRAKKA